MDRKRVTIVFILMLVCLALLVWINAVTGSVSIPPGDVISVVLGRSSDEMWTNIIMNIRLPRMIAAIVLGGCLALSGYLLQTFFDNPIVGPFVLGISSGAKLTVALTLIFLLSKGHNIGSFGMIVSAFAGAMMAMGLVLLISSKTRSMSLLVICGIMIGYICSAITDFVVTFADDSNIVNLHNWSMGSLNGINMTQVTIMSVIALVCLACAVCMSKPISAYRLGQAYAASMGVNIRLLKVMLIVISSLLAASVTAFAGPISFVGIAVPHLVGNTVRTSSPAVMIPSCFLGGAVVTLMCDCIARSIFAPTEVSISSVTAVLLVPVVIRMMLGRRKNAG
ncbi:MAG: iron ABC transporter permease [Lachnospiraceae bacterium]|nr:iron ABC transporter permease [Lachnospiraceae bacterium]